MNFQNQAIFRSSFKTCSVNFTKKPSELHIADGENLVNNPNEEWGKILDFLGVSKKDFNFEVRVSEVISNYER